MNIRYKRKANESLMVIKDERIKLNNYKIKMIMKNKIPGLLEIYTSILNGEAEINYIVSSKQSLKDLIMKGKLSYEELYNIIKSIIDLEEQLEKYFLNIEDIVLVPEYIFINKSNQNIEYCYFMNEDKSFIDLFKEFVQRLIQVTNHSDKKAVTFIYEIFELCNEEGFVLSDVKKYLSNKYISEKEEECIEKEEKPILYNEKNIYKTEESDYKIHLEKKGIFEQVKDFILGIRHKDSLVCEDEGEYNTADVFESDITIRESQNQYYYNRDADSVENSEENKTMFIADIIKQKDRQLFSMSELDDIQIKSFPFIIGKISGKADAVINDPSISRMHIKIDYDKDKDEYTIEDLNSKNGTKVNDDIINPYEIINISIGDKITIASFDFIFR